jgi:hypothetical protein
VRGRVATVGHLTVHIYHREHPPPHFHVQRPGLNASFSLLDGELLKGEASSREIDLIRWWFKRARPQLVAHWNRTRPTDCPVGPID